MNLPSPIIRAFTRSLLENVWMRLQLPTHKARNKFHLTLLSPVYCYTVSMFSRRTPRSNQILA